MNVSKPQEALTTDEFISSLMESPDQPEEEVTTAEDTAEEADQSDAEAEDAEEVTASDQSEEEPEEAEEEDAAPQEEHDPDQLYQIGSEQTSEAELKELRLGNMRNANYTQGKQELAEQRRETEAVRAELDTELGEVQQLKAQLKDALATHAIAPVEEPNWAELKPEQIGPAMAKYQREQAQKEQAAAHFKALQQQQEEETEKEREAIRQRESASLLQKFPQWSDPAVFSKDFDGMAKLAEKYQITRQELEGSSDHRVLWLLMDYQTARAATDTSKAVTTKAEKKLVQAAKKVTPGVKGAQDRGAKKQRQQQMQRLKKTGSVDDFAELLMGGA